MAKTKTKLVNLEELTADELEQFLNAKRGDERAENEKKKKAYEQMRNNTVERLCASAIVESNRLKNFKDLSLADLRAFYAAMKDYSKGKKDGKGNFEIVNEAQNLKVEFSSQIRKAFDERAAEAEVLLRTFLQSIMKGKNKEAYELVSTLLERKVNGDYDIRLIQRLYKMEDRYTDENWVKAIKLFKESYMETDTCEYIRFYKKDGTNKWQIIPLNLSAI